MAKTFYCTRWIIDIPGTRRLITSTHEVEWKSPVSGADRARSVNNGDAASNAHGARGPGPAECPEWVGLTRSTHDKRTAGFGAKPAFGPADDVRSIALLVIGPDGDPDVPPTGTRRLTLGSIAPAAAILASRKAGITCFAKGSRSSSRTSRGVPSSVAQMTRSRQGSAYRPVSADR